MNDVNHTPRRRNADDSSMWNRLNQIRSGAKVWASDGISNVPFNLVSKHVEGGDQPVFADPALLRSFTLHWSSVSVDAFPDLLQRFQVW